MTAETPNAAAADLAQASSRWGAQASCLRKTDRQDACLSRRQDVCATNFFDKILRAAGSPGGAHSICDGDRITF